MSEVEQVVPPAPPPFDELLTRAERARRDRRAAAQQRAARHLGWRDVAGILVTGGRLLGRHWPRMLCAAMLGIAFRNAIIWGSVVVSDIAGWAAQLLLVLAPLGYLLPVVYMLRLCAADLPSLRAAASAQAPEMPTEGRRQRLIDVAISVLVPFLAIYTSYGLLEEDRLVFRNEAASSELFSTIDGDEIDFVERLQLDQPLWFVLALVVVALVLRWVLGRLERAMQFVAIAFIGALIELVWTVYLSEWLEDWRKGLLLDLQQTRAAIVVMDAWSFIVERAGWAGITLDATATWALGMLGSIGTVLLVPIAWLVVAAVVLGHRIMPAAPEDHPAVERAMRALPAPVRRMTDSFASDLGSRWSALFSGIGLVLRAGAVPMLTFCVVFLVAYIVPWLTSWAARLLRGPVDIWSFLAFAPWENAIGLSLQLLVIAPMLAAAVDRFVTPADRQAGFAAQQTHPFPAGSDTRGAPE